MNQTSNYGFNVPVGSDIVNPLVQDFPNWDSLDTILRNIANTGVTTGTHTKAGTIHTLTFSDTTVPMIRFQATADFHTNDTFTVNGLSVSALTVTGEALPDGAFVIGSMVLCELRDNLLTVYTSGTDANTLQGHPASYFATASDLQTVDDKADANRVLIDQINSDLSNIGLVSYSQRIGINGGSLLTNVTNVTFISLYKQGNVKVGFAIVNMEFQATDTTVTITGLPTNGSGNSYVNLDVIMPSHLPSDSSVNNAQIPPDGASLTRSNLSVGKYYQIVGTYVAIETV